MNSKNSHKVIFIIVFWKLKILQRSKIFGRHLWNVHRSVEGTTKSNMFVLWKRGWERERERTKEIWLTALRFETKFSCLSSLTIENWKLLQDLTKITGFTVNFFFFSSSFLPEHRTPSFRDNYVNKNKNKKLDNNF